MSPKLMLVLLVSELQRITVQKQSYHPHAALYESFLFATQALFFSAK